jgi:thioredoxin-related protein
MKLLLITAYMCMPWLSSFWLTDFEQAKKQAQEKHALILLNFSGSDWCGPCVRLHKEIFDGEAFTKMAGQKLVLLNADFPRLKKNQLTAQQQKQNDMLAEKYNPEGHFPLTVLLNAKGVVLKTWEGYPRQGVEGFISEMQTAIDDNR